MIREAQLKDYARCVELITEFARSSPIAYHRSGEVILRRTQTTLLKISQQGIILVAERDGDIQGLIVGQVIPDLLFPEYKTLREIVWWVTPKYRHTSIGYRLLQAYEQVGQDWLQAGKIQDIVMTTLINSPDLHLERRGWREIEKNYVLEGVN